MSNIPSSLNPSARRWAISILIAGLGAGWQYLSLWWIEQFVTVFPSVPDVLMDRLPRYSFGFWGEVLFFGLILLFSIPHFRWHWRDTPQVLISLGLFYFVRGWFMFLFPIGAPAGSLPPSDRLDIWGYATHAYFPGGHIGIITVLALHARQSVVRRWMWAGITLFGVGTMLAKNHYTMDSVGGILLAYAVTTWVGGRLSAQRP